MHTGPSNIDTFVPRKLHSSYKGTGEDKLFGGYTGLPPPRRGLQGGTSNTTTPTATPDPPEQLHGEGGPLPPLSGDCSIQVEDVYSVSEVRC